MSLLTLYSIAAGTVLTLVILAVRGRLVNWFYALCVIADALKDVACQLWIDVSGVFRRRRKDIDLDDFERMLS